ncbi:hypothetical protein [Rhodococcus sp. NPDC058521]|uniref:hypothetical protein n=1 Tax=Rhodococcus sp. NPDC058521 TaxID=3346536 RepID=UPI00366611FF
MSLCLSGSTRAVVGSQNTEDVAGYREDHVAARDEGRVLGQHVGNLRPVVPEQEKDRVLVFPHQVRQIVREHVAQDERVR